MIVEALLHRIALLMVRSICGRTRPAIHLGLRAVADRGPDSIYASSTSQLALLPPPPASSRLLPPSDAGWRIYICKWYM